MNDFLNWFFGMTEEEKAFYGHAGRPGKRGGSVPASSAMSMTTGRAAVERMQGNPKSRIASANPQNVPDKKLSRVEQVRKRMEDKKDIFEERAKQIDKLQMKYEISMAVCEKIMEEHHSIMYPEGKQKYDLSKDEVDKLVDLNAKANKKRNEALQYLEEKKKLEEEILSESIDALTVENHVVLDTVSNQWLRGKELSKKRQEEVKEYSKQIERVIPADKLVPGSNWTNTIYTTPRACYYERGVINLGSGKGATWAHEFGHHFESYSPGARKKANEFLAKRTQGEKKKRLPNIPSEFAFFDKFLNPYMGKFYSRGNTEIISMGLEYLVSNPYKMMREDPEYFDFMIDVLQGE